jgi:Streptomyces sporulation and cell division protein, SsgA.
MTRPIPTPCTPPSTPEPRKPSSGCSPATSSPRACTAHRYRRRPSLAVPSHGQGVVCIALSSPEGEALLEAPARALESFLKRTDAAVPPGTEHRHFDLDTELSHILAES